MITLLLMADHRPAEWEWRGQKYQTKPGQFITSLANIAREAGTDISIRNVRTALLRFEKYEFLTNESTKQNRLITITNWAHYQVSIDEPDKATDNRPTKDRQRTDKDLTTNKNERKEESKNKRKEEKHTFAEFVQMSEPEHQRLVERYGPDITARAIELLDYYKGASGKKYASDYRAILSWAGERAKKEAQKEPPQRPKLVPMQKPPAPITESEWSEAQRIANKLK